MAATKERCRQQWTEGEDRPRCSGHGELMVKDGENAEGIQKWRCRARFNANQEKTLAKPEIRERRKVYGRSPRKRELATLARRKRGIKEKTRFVEINGVLCCSCHGEPAGGTKRSRCTVKSRLHQRLWRERNPEKVREARKRWRTTNLEWSRERSRLWREQNPEKVRDSNRRNLVIYAGGMALYYGRVDPAEKERITSQLAVFRARQNAEYKEASSGW